MVNRCERANDRLADRRDFLKREVAFIELAIADDGVHYFYHYRADVFRIRTRQRPRCCLTRICQHHDRRFLKLWLWPRITKIFFLDHFTWFGHTLGLSQ